MAYQYFTTDNVVEVYKTSKQYTEGLTDRFPEFERLARNKPHPSIPKEYPKVTDGTTASIIRKTPHRIIQQLPTGKVHSDTDDWLTVIASFIYTNRIIPYANENYALLQKCWNVVERFLTFGFCPTYVPFVQHAGYFCTDLRLIYWGDIFIQPGKLSDADSNYVFMRSWWQTKDIEALIDSQSKLDPKQRTWNIKALKHVKDQPSTKDEKSKTPVEKEAQINASGGVELITGFQRGVGAKFYTFHVTTGEIVRTKKNKDPRGELPISFAYGDIDGASPFGRSIIELVGGLQNLMDAEMQMYQYNRALQLNPPVHIFGVNKNKFKYAPNTIVESTNPEAFVKPVEIDTTALANFPANYQLMQSQLFGLLATPNTTISAEVGSVAQSKTPQGVEQNKANLNIDDNYVRKQFETWFERWSETAINLYFAEREGIEELQLDNKTVQELIKLAQEGKFDPNLLSEDNKIRIDFSSATEKLKFEVDASTSKMQDEAEQLQSLSLMEDFLRKSPLMQEIVPPEVQAEVWNAFVRNTKIEDPEKLSLDEKKIQEILQKMQNKPPETDENVITNFKDLPEDSKAYQLQKLGFPPPQTPSPAQMQAQPAPQTDQGGMTPDHILKADDQAHRQGIDMAKLNMEMDKMRSGTMMEAAKIMQQGEMANKQHQVAMKQANKPQPKPAKVKK